MRIIKLTNAEKIAIQQYLRSPQLYLHPDLASKILSESGNLPEGTKVSRKSNKGKEKGRCYIIPSTIGADVTIIPVKNLLETDPIKHSATWLSGSIFFHQNKEDLDKILPDNFDDICEPFESDESDESDESVDSDDRENRRKERAREKYLAYREGWVRALGQPDYVLNRIDPSFYKNVVKRAVDENGETFFLKSFSSCHKDVVKPSNNLERFFPTLFAGPTLFKTVHRYEKIVETKKLTITKDVGQDLFQYLQDNDVLESEKREQLGIAIINAYVNQLLDNEIVHTDIKPGNICVTETGCRDEPFLITFIDLDEAFLPDSQEKSGHGTIAYLAPEFFKSKTAFSARLLKESQGDENLLIDEYQFKYSTASDLFALGQVLIAHLRPEKSSSLYVLGNQLMHYDINERLAIIDRLRNMTPGRDCCKSAI